MIYQCYVKNLRSTLRISEKRVDISLLVFSGFIGKSFESYQMKNNKKSFNKNYTFLNCFCSWEVF